MNRETTCVDEPAVRRPWMPVLPTAPPPVARGRDDEAIAGSRATPLTSRQRQLLAAAARRAWVAQTKLGLGGSGSFNDWRHEQCLLELGAAGLRELDQARYGRAMAHFLTLAGGTPRRGDWRAAGKRPARDDADRARWSLRRECTALAADFGSEAGADAYATSLLLRIHKTDWMSANAKQLWQVLFTMRNRARARSKK